MTPPIKVAPTEPASFRAIGTTSLLPERFGVDAFFTGPIGTVGVQRKEWSDFLASMADGRLAKETSQAQRLTVRMLVLEGKPRWTLDGVLVNDFGPRYTRPQHLAYLMSLRQAGWWVETSCNLEGTIETVKVLHQWAQKIKHTSLVGRGDRPKASGWGKHDDRDYQIHMLTSLPDIGAELAGRIIDKFGGVPFRWRVSREDLLTVHGLGKKKVDRIYRALAEYEPDHEGERRLRGDG